MTRLVVIACVILLAACAGPRPEVPSQATVISPQDWRTEPGAPPRKVGATWWQAFGDPALTEIVEAALANNVDIEIAAARVAESRGQFHLARAERLPDVTGAFEGARQ